MRVQLPLKPKEEEMCVRDAQEPVRSVSSASHAFELPCSVYLMHTFVTITHSFKVDLICRQTIRDVVAKGCILLWIWLTDWHSDTAIFMLSNHIATISYLCCNFSDFCIYKIQEVYISNPIFYQCLYTVCANIYMESVSYICTYTHIILHSAQLCIHWIDFNKL